MEVPRLRVESQLQRPAYDTATATRDLSSELHLQPTPQLTARPGPYPLGEARDRTCILIRFCCATTGTPWLFFKIFLQEFFGGRAVKDPASSFSLVAPGSPLWCRFISCPGNFCMPWAWPKKMRLIFLQIKFQLHSSHSFRRQEKCMMEKYKWCKLNPSWSSHRGAIEMNPTRNHEVAGSIPGLAQRVNNPVLPWAVV